MQSGTRNRGFASMNREKQREIARKGGRAAHEKGTAHEFTSDEARAAGRKQDERLAHQAGSATNSGGRRSSGGSITVRGRSRVSASSMPMPKASETIEEPP